MAIANVQAAADAQVEAASQPSKGALRMRSYRSRGGDQIPTWMRQEVFERDGYRCCECDADDRLECDHVIPLMHRGPTTVENLQTLCRSCNARKKDRIRKSDARGQLGTIADNCGNPRIEAENTSPSLPPLLPPQTPPTTPPSLPHEYITTHAKSRILWIVAAGIEALCRAATPKPTAKRKWPRAMPPPPEVTDDQWAGFVAHRLALRKPLTDRAYEMLVAKLAAEATDEWPPGRIVDEMVERVWLSFKTEWLRNSTETRNESVRSSRASASRTGDGFANALHEASGYRQADFRH